MRRFQSEIEGTENPFSLSIGDLMAALLLIFILLLTSTLLELRKSVEGYSALKRELYDSLSTEFSQDFKLWKAELDSSLTIRFKEPDVLFASDRADLNGKFKSILDNFFPRYIKILTNDKFKNYIEEIRIEGHTDNTANYYYNMDLSQQRTRSVLMYVLENTEIMKSDNKQWVQHLLTANGLSFSKPLVSNATSEGRKLNRRVEFRVRTNAEKKMQEITGNQ